MEGSRPSTAAPAPDGVIAAIGRWDLTALVVNTIIGSGIFGLPILVLGLVGGAAPWAYLAAGAGIAVIVFCFAEVGAQFDQAGGPYLYARQAFGRFAGLQVGWITWLMRVSAAAATARIFTAYLAVFWPPALAPLPQALLITLLFATLAAVNICGVEAGTRTGNWLLLVKLTPLAVFIAVGVAYIRPANLRSWPAPAGPAPGHWLEAVLLLIFAFGGFDNALFPGSEMRNPRRDVPFALLAGTVIVAVFYFGIQWVFQGTVSGAVVSPAMQAQPLAVAAGVFLGGVGAKLIAAGAMISVWGWFAATILGTPRLTFAMGRNGDLPARLGRLHPRFRTPHVSILAYAGLSWALALAGSFAWNASLSAVARLVTYGVTCAALPVLRRRSPGGATFRVPGGLLFPALGIGFCLLLVTRIGRVDLLLLLAVSALAAVTWAFTTPNP